MQKNIEEINAEYKIKIEISLIRNRFLFMINESVETLKQANDLSEEVNWLIKKLHYGLSFLESNATKEK
jgi:hypothetical protein